MQVITTSVIPPGGRAVGATSTKARRFSELDAMRGVAAIVVLFHHFASAYPLSHSRRFLFFVLLRPLTAGHEAVLLFFVLSGFVLSLPTWRSNTVSYSSYLIRRFCRIYPPYFVALFVAVAGAHQFHGHHVLLSPWFGLTWTVAPTWRLVGYHLLFLGDYDSSQFNTAFWSIVFETRISLIFPFVCARLTTMSTLTGILCAVGCSFCTFVLWSIFPSTQTGASRLWDTPHYLAFFILGALLARFVEQKPHYSASTFCWLRSVPAIALFFFGFMVVVHGTDSLARRQIGEWLCAIGALELVYLGATRSPIQGMLSRQVIVSLGRSSYSLYLLHGTVLFVLLDLLFPLMPAWLIFILFVGLSLAAAQVGYQWIELPSVLLGKWLTGTRDGCKRES